MMPRNPDSEPSANADSADVNGMLKTNTVITKAAMTPYSAAHGADIPRWRTPLASRCGCSAMK